MVVDDDRLNIRILAGLLQTEGYVIAEANSGEQALEVYEGFRPDLVLLDVVMPGIDGFETCRELRNRYGVNAAPVIFITAKNDSEDVVEGLASGGVDYLPKPFRRKEALARIRTHLQNRILIEQQKLLVEQLKQANDAKNKLVGMAAHDLRNPLASIRGLAEFLTDGTVGPMSPDQLDLVKMIHSESQSMLNLVNELLDVSTIAAGELKINRESCDLAELLEKSVYLSNINAARKSTRISLQTPQAPVTAMIDASKIRQVVDNLLSNAIKYSPPASEVRVRLQKSDTGLEIAVQDQGPGIPEGERHRLFKDFGTLSVKPTGGEKATGLGLAICHKIVEAHQGSIAATNLPNGGCEFSIQLPA
ncbi:MAG TPA: hybrid sensor histidine kinase/response regulator [Opitutaceae bacterium]|nr:hybrid sensor histidine kinase/response regulator [Opitutaceae bacterium]